jgi:prevent-host-death family protein
VVTTVSTLRKVRDVRAIGTRELKAHLGEVLRDVRERQETIAITHHGRAIARLVPEPETQAETADFDRTWAELDEIAAEIGREWPEGVSAAGAVSADRREL